MIGFSQSIVLTLLVVAAIIHPGILLGASQLSDQELLGVHSGGAEYASAGQGQKQQPQPPQHVSPRQQVPELEPSSSPRDNVNGFPSTMAVLESEVDLDIERDVTLTDTSQKSIIALNLTNSYASDVTGATNIVGGKKHLQAGELSLHDVMQENDIRQNHRQQGMLSSSVTGHSYTLETTKVVSGEIIDLQNRNVVDQQDRHDSYQSSANYWDVGVAPVRLGELDVIERTVDNPTPWTYQLLPGFTVGKTIDTGWFGKYGGEATYAGMELIGPTASFNGLQDQDQDLLLGVTLKLPELNFGAISFEGCVGVGCIGGEATLGSIGGTDLMSVLASIDNSVAPDDFLSFTKDGILLKGLGELLGDELNLNTGFALSGSGHLELVEPPRIVIGGEVRFSVEAALRVALDLSSIDGLGLIKNFFKKDAAKWDYSSGDQSVIDLTIPFTLVDDHKVQKFALDYNGVVVLQLGSGNVTVDNLEDYSFTDSFHDATRVEEHFASDIGSSYTHESSERSVFTGGQITQAEAELLAMSEGTLSATLASDVNMTSMAQQRMKTMHAVNAVGSVAANSLNVGKLPTMDFARSGGSFRQQNNFAQKR